MICGFLVMVSASSFVGLCTHHTRAHPWTHTHSFRHIHMPGHTHSFRNTHSHAYACTHTHIFMCLDTCIHRHTHKDSTHQDTCAHSYIQSFLPVTLNAAATFSFLQPFRHAIVTLAPSTLCTISSAWDLSAYFLPLVI